MKNIKNIQFGKLAMIAAIAFMATSCQQDEVLDQYDPKPQGETISFHIQRGWDYDKISRSTGTQYGEHISDNNLVSEDNSESMKMGVYQQPIDSWFGGANSRGTMIQSADFSEFLAFGYKTKTENGTATTTPIFESSYHDIGNNTTNSTEDAGWEKPVGTGENANGYYWPGSDYTCSFFGISMSDGKLTDTNSGTSVYNNVTTKKNTAGQIIGFDYTVPALAVNQPDIMVAAANNIPGDGSSSVSLDFKHILTAVNVKVGVKTGETTMPNGKITSIKFKNIYGKGTYSVETNTWSGFREWANGDGTAGSTGIGLQEYSVDLGTEGFSTNNINQTTKLNANNATLMMLPQTLHSDAAVVIEYLHEKGTTATISAPLGGMNWPMGKEVNYLISISPAGDLMFTSSVPAIDAHYVIVPFTISNTPGPNVNNKNWRMTAKFSNEDAATNIHLRTELSTLQAQGYWTDNEFGSDDDNNITRSTQGKNINVYAFIPENNSTTSRDVELTLYAGSSDKAAASMKFTQLGLNDQNGERIEETGYVPWGFSWDSDTSVEYTIGYSTFVTAIQRLIAEIYELFTDGLISSSGGLFGSNLKITIHLNKVPTDNLGVNDEDSGYENTKTIYGYKGLDSIEDLVNTIKEWGGKITQGEMPQNPSEYAARSCIMKNKFKKITRNNGSESEDYPILESNDDLYDGNETFDYFVWYLPAMNEYELLDGAEGDGTYKLEGEYWTSTAPQGNNAEAYKYTAGTGSSLENRNEFLKVRCMRH